MTWIIKSICILKSYGSHRFCLIVGGTVRFSMRTLITFSVVVSLFVFLSLIPRTL